MNINLFDYYLPEKLIAQYPIRNRDESKLLVLDRAANKIEIHSFKEIVNYFNNGDALVVNNTKVFKARLIGNRVSGGKVEVFLVRKIENEELLWLALARPSRRLKENEEICFDAKTTNNRESLLLKKKLEGDKWVVEFNSEQSRNEIIERFGHVPLPHYIKRPDIPDDIDRYQTIFAKPEKTGAVAAPTAGFHFTESIISQLRNIGVKIVELTLHVGPGTFKPVQAENINDHKVDPEYAILSEDAAKTINEVRSEGNKIVAVGTTSVRTLESAKINKKGEILPFEGMVDLYIKPGFNFRVVDRLLTNFHLPRSSLLILVSALAGREKILKAYQNAVENNFRFYSYGDAMFIL